MNDTTFHTTKSFAYAPEAVSELDLPSIVSTHHPALDNELDERFKSSGVHHDALGHVKSLAMQLARIRHPVTEMSTSVTLQAPQLLIFAADHGICDEGVSTFPQEATRQRVLHMLHASSSTVALANMQGVAVTVVDAGVASHLLPAEHGPTAVPLLTRKIAYGTRNMLIRPAMSGAQAMAGLNAGMDVARQVPGNVLAIGDVGVGSTSCAALLFHRLCGAPLVDACGQGSRRDEVQLKRKLEVLQRAVLRHRNATTPMDILASMGGFEIAMTVGAMLQAASERRVILVDGYVGAAAALVARALSPNVMDYLVFAHRSADLGHRLLLVHLQKQPLIDMALRMGEGMGTMLAWPMLKAAEQLLADH